MTGWYTVALPTATVHDIGALACRPMQSFQPSRSAHIDAECHNHHADQLQYFNHPILPASQHKSSPPRVVLTACRPTLPAGTPTGSTPKTTRAARRRAGGTAPRRPTSGGRPRTRSGRASAASATYRCVSCRGCPDRAFGASPPSSSPYSLPVSSPYSLPPSHHCALPADTLPRQIPTSPPSLASFFHNYHPVAKRLTVACNGCCRRLCVKLHAGAVPGRAARHADRAGGAGARPAAAVPAGVGQRQQRARRQPAAAAAGRPDDHRHQPAGRHRPRRPPPPPHPPPTRRQRPRRRPPLLP